MVSRARRHVRQSFRISTKGHGKPVRQVRTGRQLRFEERANVFAHLFGLCRPNLSVQVESGHQTHGAERQLSCLLYPVIVQNTDSKAPPAETCNTPRLAIRPRGGKPRFPAEPRFFDSADHFQLDTRLLPYSINEWLPIARFARSAGRNRA